MNGTICVFGGDLLDAIRESPPEAFVKIVRQDGKEVPQVCKSKKPAPMHHEQYTPDAICRSMGLPAFVEPGWSPVTLRVLLNPSFDPEVCLTLSGSHDDTRLSVVALAEMLWHQPWPRPMATRREEISVPASVLRDALEAFGPAATAARERQPVCLDGMSLVACLQAEAESSRFECNVFAAAAVFEFAAILVRSAWNSCRESAVRNALATCGRYVGLDLPQEPVPKVPEPYRISVLGTPDARAEFFGLLPSHGERGIPQCLAGQASA